MGDTLNCDTGLMKSVKLSSQQPYALSFWGNTHACGGGIAGLPVAGFVWTAGCAVRSDVLESTISPFFAICKILLVAT